ncbi:ATP-binding cassette domain-containing protein [Rossellomorea sp. H39__3]
MGSVKVTQLTKEFSGVHALKNVNLDIQEGEFFALLGPSGCGKTTTMRCIAGFEQPTSGIITIGQKR